MSLGLPFFMFGESASSVQIHVEYLDCHELTFRAFALRSLVDYFGVCRATTVDTLTDDYTKAKETLPDMSDIIGPWVQAGFSSKVWKSFRRARAN